MLKIFGRFIFLSVFIIALSSCNNSITSSATGWPYDFKADNAFDVSSKQSNQENQVPAGMVLIPGGSITVDDVEDYESVNRRLNPSSLNLRKTLNINSFYMDTHEVRNIDWREYIAWLTAVYAKSSPKTIENARPDMREWNKGLGDNEPFMMNYFTHPSFNDYPVVCISWEQASEYCAWRTDRTNELLLIQQGIIIPPDFNVYSEISNPDSLKKMLFSTKDFFANNFVNPGKSNAVLFPDFRLPSEDEWEYAAFTRKFAQSNGAENIAYPWEENHSIDLKKSKLNVNYNKSSITGGNTDVFSRTIPVTDGIPNEFGLYNMTGNVNEWVFDRYNNKANISKIDSTDIIDALLPDNLKTNDCRVYKGGSWKDPVYWLHPSGRRGLNQKNATADIGFRCAMSAIPLQIKK